jgi:tripartite-type tricarboxylate transporter receptor subunit TctC
MRLQIRRPFLKHQAMPRHWIFTTFWALVGLMALASVASAQDFPPKKTISMVVGFVPGGAADTGARIIAKKLGENLGVAVTVENKAGAGGNIAH